MNLKEFKKRCKEESFKKTYEDFFKTLKALSSSERVRFSLIVEKNLDKAKFLNINLEE